MCFYNDDCDWVAEYEEQKFFRDDSECKCRECDRTIKAGEWRQHFFQQESEVCRICEDDCSYDFVSKDPDDYDTNDEHASALAELASHEHDYGETFSANICRECCLVLEAIYDLERIEGCPEHARQPAIGDLVDVVYEDKRWEGGKYVRHAVEMFPELATHKLITAE
jgi:hypothetical protein